MSQLIAHADTTASKRYESAECPRCKGRGMEVIFRGRGGNPMPARCRKCGGEGFIEKSEVKP